MTTMPTSTYATSNDRTVAEMKQVIADMINFTKQLRGATAESELTIASGIITPTSATHIVDTESDAASDTLQYAATTNLPEGSVLRIWAANTDRTVVIEHQAGGIGQFVMRDSANYSLDDTLKWIEFKRVGNDWKEVQRLDFAVLGTAAGYDAGSAIGDIPVLIDDGSGNPIVDPSLVQTDSGSQDTYIFTKSLSGNLLGHTFNGRTHVNTGNQVADNFTLPVTESSTWLVTVISGGGTTASTSTSGAMIEAYVSLSSDVTVTVGGPEQPSTFGAYLTAPAGGAVTAPGFGSAPTYSGIIGKPVKVHPASRTISSITGWVPCYGMGCLSTSPYTGYNREGHMGYGSGMVQNAVGPNYDVPGVVICRRIS